MLRRVTTGAKPDHINAAKRRAKRRVSVVGSFEINFDLRTDGDQWSHNGRQQFVVGFSWGWEVGGIQPPHLRSRPPHFSQKLSN